MTTVTQKLPPPNSYSYIDLRRHSSAHPTASSTSSSRKDSIASTNSQPAWMTSIQERDRQGSSQSTPEARSSGLKGLFGRRRSVEKKEEKIVIGSKHAALVKNKLKVDPRGARKHPSVPVKTVGVQGTQTSAHITAEEQELRHPHSGPPTLRGAAHLPMLTKIVSGDEDDDGDYGRARGERDKRMTLDVGSVLETHGEEVSSADVDVERVKDVQTRRKSLVDVEIKGGEEVNLTRRKTVFGGWAKDSKGVWTRG